MALIDKIKKEAKKQVKKAAKEAVAPKKPAPAQDEAPKVIWTKTFTQLGTFRGYRRIRPSRYPHAVIDETVAVLEESEYNMKGREIRLDLIESKEKYNEYKVVKIFVDGMLIGSVFNSDEVQFPMLTEYEYDKVYLRIEDTWPGCTDPRIVHTKVYLFVHYPGVAPLKVEVK